MAKAAWAVVTPPQGSGDKEVSVRSDAEHTGRNARSTVLTWKAVNCPDVQRTVMQAGKPEYVDIADTAASEKTGKVVTISGVSNSKRLTFSLGMGDLEIALPGNYTANSVLTANGEAIAGDPGGLAVYDFSIAVTVPANTEIEPQTRQVIVTDEGRAPGRMPVDPGRRRRLPACLGGRYPAGLPRQPGDRERGVQH